MGDFAKDELNSIIGSSSKPKTSEEPFIMNSSHSKYDEGFIPYDNIDPNTSYNALANYRGEQQGRFAKLGAGLVNTVTGTALDIAGDVGYLLDTENITNFQKSSEEGFNNWLSDWTNKTKEALKLPIYRTDESKGFSPLSAGWWGDNMPSIASTISMMVPAEAGVSLLSKAAELLGGEKLIKGIEGVTGITGLGDKAKGVTGAILSRHMESLMEGGQTYKDTYQKALQATNDPEKAKKIAGKAASENYKLNWAAIVQDLPEYMLLHKTFKESSSAFSKQGAKEALKIAGIEGSEEAYQFITDKESQRQALLDGKVLKDDNTSFGDRMLNYGKDGDFWTSAFLGALGGAGFGLYGVHKDNKTQKSFDGLLEQHKAVLTGDPTAYKRGENSILNNAIVDNIANGTLDKFQSGLNTILSNPERIKDEDRVEVSKNVKSALEHVEYAKNIANSIINDKSIPNELKKTVFATQLEQKSSEDRLSDINNQLNVLRGKQIVASQITPDLLVYKEAKLTLEGISKIPNLQGVHKELTKNINQTAKDLLEAYPAFKTIEKLDEFVIGSQDEEFKKLLTNKEQENLIIKGAKEILYKSKTTEGKEELLKEQEKAKKKAEKEAKLAKEAALAKQKTTTLETSNGLEDEIDANTAAEFDETDVTSQPEITSTDSNELYPNTKSGDALNNIERDRISTEHKTSNHPNPLLDSNEVQLLINKHGNSINNGIKFKISELNGVKSIAIIIGNRTLGYSNTKNSSEVQQLFQQAIKLIENGKLTELSNEQVKALGFKLIIDNGYINNTTTNPLHLNELNSLVQTNGEYVIFDRGSRKHISENREPFLITEAIEPGKEGSILPNAIRQLGRYIMSFKDSSGNWKYIPLSPAKLANVDKYLNSLRELSAKIVKGDEKGKLTSAQIGELQGQIQDTFISLPKSTFKNGVFDVEIFIAEDGNLVVNKVEPSGVKGVKDKITKLAGIKANELPALTSNGALISYINELIAAKEPSIVLTEDSFRESVPTGKFLDKKESDKLFQAYVTPEVIHKQDVKIELNKPVVESKTLVNETDNEEDFSDIVASDDPLGAKPVIEQVVLATDKKADIEVSRPFGIKRGDKIQFILTSYNKREEPFRSKNIEEGEIEAVSEKNKSYKIKGNDNWYRFKDNVLTILKNYTKDSELATLEEKPLDRRAQNAAKNKNAKLTGDVSLALKLVDSEFDQEKVNYIFKGVKNIQDNLPKVKIWFKNIGNTDTFWNKLQKDLQIPKEQIELLRNSEGNTIEEKLVDFVAKYSYSVEVKTALDKFNGSYDLFDWQSHEYNTGLSGNGRITYYKMNALDKEEKISKEEYEQAYDNYKLEKQHPAQIYANLTVPGGTNYTENEIATPLITPSIKGHAQFSTDRGIGWFRSDEQEYTETIRIATAFDKGYLTDEEMGEAQASGMSIEDIGQSIEKSKRGEKPTAKVKTINNKDFNQPKTRRILEVQSDLFQKGRTISLLTGNKDIDNAVNEGVISGANASEWMNHLEKDSKNQFLQLLNKDNNWVTFFVKSIIQDSAKKGYEKVLFPSGNTASKVEGHTTLEEFKRDKENRIKAIEANPNSFLIKNGEYKLLNGNYIIANNGLYDLVEKKDFENNWKHGERIGAAIVSNILNQDNISNYSDVKLGDNQIKEINQLKQELERVETEGFGALKPIYNFYENTVKNILKKNYNIKEVTDEYGNTWNEINLNDIKTIDSSNLIVFKLSNKTIDKLIDSHELSEIERITSSDISIETRNDLRELIGNVPNSKTPWGLFRNQAIYLWNQAGSGTGYHEAFHAIFRMGINNKDVDRYLKLAEKEVLTKYKNQSSLYKALDELRASHMSYTNLSEQQIYELLLEEHMADRFAEWKLSPENSKAATGLKQLFKRILNMIKHLFKINDSLELFFDKINRGAFSETKSIPNRILGVTDAAFKNLNASPNTFMSSSRSKQIINTFAALVRQKYVESKHSLGKSERDVLEDLIKERVDLLYDNGYSYAEGLEDKVKSEKLIQKIDEELFLLENLQAKEILSDQVINKLKLFTNKQEEKEDFEEVKDGDDNTTERHGSQESWTISLEDSTGNVIKEYISFATYKTIDELTGKPIILSVDAQVIYNGLGHALSNTDESQIVNKFITYALDNPQAKAVLDMIIADTELGVDYEKGELIGDAKKNLNDLRRIIVAFKNSKVDFYTTTFVPTYTNGVLTSNIVKVFNANLNRAEKLTMKNWASNLFSLRENKKITDFQTPINTINSLFRNRQFEGTYTKEDLNKRISALQEQFNEIGMPLSSGYLRYSMLMYHNSKGLPLTEGQLNYISNWSDIVTPLDIDKIGQGSEYTWIGQVKAGKDPYDRGADNESIGSYLESYALGNSYFDESIGSSNFKGSDDNTRYDIIKGSYVLDESRKLRNKQYRDQKVKEYPILKDNALLNDEKFLNNLTVNLIDGVRDISFSTNEGKVFGDFTEREYLMQHLGYWFAQTKEGVHTLFRQNEASNTAYDTVMPVNSYVDENGKPNESAINKVYDNFKAEFDRIKRETANGLGDKLGYNNTEDGRAFRFTEFSNLIFLLGPAKYFQIEGIARNAEQELTPELINEVKKAIKTSLETQIKQFKEILSTNGIIHFKGGEITENRTIPNTINGKKLDYKQLSNSLSDFYLNDYINSFALNQLFDGDYALSRDDKGLIDVKLNDKGEFDENGTTYRLPKQALVIDITKRNKGAMGSGTDMGTGNHTVAFIKDINVFVNGSKDGQLIRDSKGNKINSNDAQSYTNINHIMFMARRLGRESSNVKAILRKIRRGIAINSSEQEILEHAQASLNPWKTVTFGREFYIKTSEAVLTRGMVSNITDQKAFDDIMDSMEAMEDTRELTREEYQQFNKELVKLFVPVRGMEYYHRILNQMDIHGIDQVVAQSASKGMTLIPQDSLLESMDLSKSKIEIPNSYKRLQVETPTGKATITAGTQLMQLIDSEQVDSTIYNLNGKDVTLGQIRKEYRELMASTRNNSFKMAEAYLKEYKSGNINIETLGKKFIKTLQATGADEQLLEIFKLNWNLLPTIDKAEQLFLAHFGSGIMSQKVPGTKVALMSDAHWEQVVDENNVPVLNKLVKANSEKYANYKTRKLGHNLRDSKTGKLYSECVLSERVFSKFGLKIGDKIPLELAEMLGVRIPTQDKHSMIALRVVDVLSNYLEGTGIFPSEVVLLSGADFDIDSMFIQQPAFWMDGNKAVKFGTETTKEDKWKAFKSYISKDKLFKAELANRREDNPDYHSIIKIHPKGVKDSEGNVIVKGRTEEEKAKLSAAITKTEEETLRFFGLPTNTDELEGKEINNNSLNNQILERQIALLTNKAMEDIALTPVDVEPMRDVADIIAKLKGTTNEIQNSSSSLLGKIKANFQNSAGKEGIGPVANALQGFTFLAKNKISRIGEPIKINGKELNEFKYLNSIGGRIADTLSTILSVMTDNAKDPIAGKIGLSLELLSPYNYLISLGVSLKDASLIINTPSIQMYSQLLKEGKYKLRSDSERNGSRNEKLQELFKKIRGIEGDSNYNINADIEKYSGATIETDQVEGLIIDGLKDGNREDNIRILVKFLQIEEEARYFQDLNNLIKLTKGLPTSFLEAEKVKKSIAKLGLTRLFNLPLSLEEGLLPPPFDLSESIKNDDLLFNNVKNALTVLDHSSKIFISESAPFQREFKKLLLNLKSNLKEEQVKELKRSLLGFISTRAYIKYMNTKIADFNPAKPELLYPQLGAKTFGSMMSDLKNSKDDNIRNNAFVKWLKIELGVKTGKGATADEQLEAQFDPIVAARVDRKESKRIAFDRVSGKSWIKLSEESINDIVNSFDDLRRNPKTTDVANAAFFYLLSKDNFEYRNDSFIKYISPMMFTNVSEGINTELNQLTKDIIGDDFAKWVDDFRINIASQFATQKYVTRLDDIRLGVNSFNAGEGLKNTNGAVYFDKGKIYFDAFDHAAFMRKLGFEKKVITFEIKNEPIAEKSTKDKSVDEILDEIKLFDSQDLEEAKEFIDTVFGLVSTKEEANKLYKKLAVKYHPDKNSGENSTEIFKYLNNTNEKFSDKVKVGGGSFEDYIKSLNLNTFGKKKGWKFPEFMVVKIGFETKLFYTPLLTGDEHVDLQAEYTEIPSFGYDTISVLPNTYEDNIETYTKLGQLKGQTKEKTQSETQQKANALISGVEEDVESFDNEYGDVGFDNSLDSENPLGVKTEEKSTNPLSEFDGLGIDEISDEDLDNKIKECK